MMRFKIPTILSNSSVSYALTLVFVVIAMLDPANSWFKLKIPTFVLLFASLLLFYPRDKRYDFVYLPLIVVSAISCTMLFLGDFLIDWAYTKQSVVFVFILSILYWRRHLNLETCLIVSSLLISLIAIIGWSSFICFPRLEEYLAYLQWKYDPWMMSRRTFGGVEIYSFFMRSISVVVIPLAICLHRALGNHPKKRLYLFATLILAAGMLVSGSRTIMMSVFLTAAIIVFLQYKHIRWIRYAMIGGTCLVIVAGVYYIFGRGSDTDVSTGIKMQHLQDYYHYFTTNWKFALFGTGPGSEIYFQGFEKYYPISEWTYFNLFHAYGIIGGLIFIAFFVYPLIELYLKRKYLPDWQIIAIAYGIYLFICGSNPYLFGSNGLIVLMFIHSYCNNPQLHAKSFR